MNESNIGLLACHFLLYYCSDLEGKTLLILGANKISVWKSMARENSHGFIFVLSLEFC